MDQKKKEKAWDNKEGMHKAECWGINFVPEYWDEHLKTLKRIAAALEKRKR